MSNFRYVRSLGEPYFAFTAENVGDLSTLPSFGLIQVTMEFRVFALPKAKASADELHPLFAFVHDLVTQPAIFEAGITPSGRIKASIRTGSVWQSAANIVGDATRWHRADFAYDGGSGQWFVTIDDHAQDTSVIDPGPAYLRPNAGYQTKLLAFNGRDGLSRSDVALRSLFNGWLGAGGATNAEYDFRDNFGGALKPKFGGPAPAAMPSDCILRAGFYDPLVTYPWGAVPTGSQDGAYRWGLGTEFTRLAKPTTKFTRVPA